MRVKELKARVDRNDYTVDPRLVAEALLRRVDVRVGLALPVTRDARDRGSAGGPPHRQG